MAVIKVETLRDESYRIVTGTATINYRPLCLLRFTVCLIEVFNMLFVTTTFSPAMLETIDGRSTDFRVVTLDRALEILQNRVTHVLSPGHASTAAVMCPALHLAMPEFDPATGRILNQPKIQANSDDEFLVFQWTGPRLSEYQILSHDDVINHHAAGNFKWVYIRVSNTFM